MKRRCKKNMLRDVNYVNYSQVKNKMNLKYLINILLTYCMEQSPSSEANWFHS